MMKRVTTIVGIMIAFGLLAGCNKGAEAPPAPTAPTIQPAIATGNPPGSVKVGDQALCAICAVKDGTTAKEEVKATLDYKGKTYAFCSEDEKAEFISNPAKYAGTP